MLASMTAMVIFEGGGVIKAKFAFQFVIESIHGYFGRKKIKSLKIQFID